MKALVHLFILKIEIWNKDAFTISIIPRIQLQCKSGNDLKDI
ncbi:hypothetical protein JM79_0913 [Gramella sp. Hel_I_59]|nr:hypothetical protein JM79_0913 [Gramella sp. Hel_I_59]